MEQRGDMGLHIPWPKATSMPFSSFQYFTGRSSLSLEFSLVRVFCCDKSPTVNDSMHMGVNANAGLIVAQDNDKISGLSAHAFKGQEFFNGIGHFSVHIDSLFPCLLP